MQKGDNVDLLHDKKSIFLSEKVLNRNLEQVNTHKGPVVSLLLKVLRKNALQARQGLKSKA